MVAQAAARRCPLRVERAWLWRGPGGLGTRSHPNHALRVGNFKLLYTMGNETWFPSEMRSDTCPYYAFSDTCATNLQALSTDCEWSNFLFDVVNDPYERNNLFHSDEHAGLRASLEARAATLLAEYSGAFDKNVAFGTTGTTWSAAREAFYEAGDYVVPWGCSAV